jgi:hypothetical protein
MPNVRKVSIQDSEEFDQVIEEKYEILAQDNFDDNAEEDSTSVEDLDDDQEIWSGGPTAGLIKTWKDQYGEVYVTSISFDKHVVWRCLSRLEYKQIVKKMEQMVQSGQLSSAEANMWNEETIAELCILYPALDKNSMNGTMAGLPSLIAQEVLEASGFVALEVRQL